MIMNPAARAFYKRILQAWHELGEKGGMKAIYRHWKKINDQYPHLNECHYDSLDGSYYSLYIRATDKQTPAVGIKFADRFVVPYLIEVYKEFPCK